jgi:hypothetical protein
MVHGAEHQRDLLGFLRGQPHLSSLSRPQRCACLVDVVEQHVAPLLIGAKAVRKLPGATQRRALKGPERLGQVVAWPSRRVSPVGQLPRPATR